MGGGHPGLLGQGVGASPQGAEGPVLTGVVLASPAFLEVAAGSLLSLALEHQVVAGPSMRIHLEAESVLD